MLKQGILHQTVGSIFCKRNYKHPCRNLSAVKPLIARKIAKLCDTNARISCKFRYVNSDVTTQNHTLRSSECNCVASEVAEGLSEEDDELCPVDCVKEFHTDEEFLKILEKSKTTGSLVVVDFYRTSCGSCKYIEKGFAKLCKGSGYDGTPVIFLKHNVLDEYDEQSEVAERLRIRVNSVKQFSSDMYTTFPLLQKWSLAGSFSNQRQREDTRGHSSIHSSCYSRRVTSSG